MESPNFQWTDYSRNNTSCLSVVSASQSVWERKREVSGIFLRAKEAESTHWTTLASFGFDASLR